MVDALSRVLVAGSPMHQWMRVLCACYARLNKKNKVRDLWLLGEEIPKPNEDELQDNKRPQRPVVAIKHNDILKYDRVTPSMEERSPRQSQANLTLVAQWLLGTTLVDDWPVYKGPVSVPSRLKACLHDLDLSTQSVYGGG